MNQELIKILADGQFHSGEEIGAQLGISRAAVWKQLQKLETANIPVNSVKGRGYRLPETVELLDIAKLVQLGFPVDEFESCELSLSLDSTNDAMMRVAEQNGLDKHICFAEMQCKGRGRRGREWVSPFARNLYFSMLWPFSQGIAAIQGLSLAVGLAVQRSLKPYGVAAGLKWPNDILVGDAKLGGILIELTGDMSDACQVVIGVGLNLDIRNQDLAHISQSATGLKQQGVVLPRNQIAADVVRHLTQLMHEFSHQGFAPFMNEWNQVNAFKDKAVRLILPSSEIQGLCQGVNEKGELMIQTELGIQVFNAGEVSLRLATSPESVL